MKQVFGALAVVGVAGIGVWQVMARETAVLIPYMDAEAAIAGARIYAEHCAACHGAALEGEADWRSPGPDGLLRAPPHDETGHTWHHADTLLFEITKYGSEAVVGGTYRSNMQGFGDVLTDAEILSVLAYIKSTWPDRVIETHNRINADARP